jgi:hypothetical protein
MSNHNGDNKSNIICFTILTVLFLIQNSYSQFVRDNSPIINKTYFRVDTFSKPKQIDFCKLLSLPEYDEKIIKTTAVLFFPPEGEVLNEPNHASVFFYDSGCNNKDYFAMSEFSQTKDRDSLENLAASNAKTNQPALIQLEFEGKASMAFIPSFGQYAWLRAEVTVNKINSAKIIEYPLPDFDAEAPIIKTGNFMKDFNANFMFSFYGRGLDKTQLDELLTSDSIITINKQDYSKKEFFDYLENGRGGSVSVRINDVSKNKDVWRIQGEITNQLKDKPPVVTKYDNKYLIEKDNSVKLIYSKLE